MNELFAFVHYRYVELESPVLLAKSSIVDSAVLGSVVRFEEGPSDGLEPVGTEEGTGGEAVTGAEQAETGRTMSMVIRVSDVAKGEPGDEVQVLLPRHDEQSAADFEKAIPPGTEAVVYLVRPPDMEPQAAAQYWVPASPQGFILDSPDGTGILYPLAHEDEERGTLSDVYPG